MIEKNQEFEVDIQDIGINGEGITKINGFTTFVKGALTGEKARIKMIKINKDYGYGKLLNIINSSRDRETPICPVFERCGGCDLQHLNYEAQLKHKVSMVKSTLKKQLGHEPLVDEVIGMGIPYYYRNKVQYPVCNGKIGFYSNRSHDLIENDICYIQNELADSIAKKTFKILMNNGFTCYNEKTGKGLLRHIIVRVGVNTEEIMLIIVTNVEKFGKTQKIINEIVDIYPNITSIIQNINKENANVILGNECRTLYGQDFIYDKLGEYKFKISPLSFYQVNPIQTEILYNTAKELANLNGNETVFDLYCGIGTISVFMANSCKKVYGIEIVPQAIENAKENAEMNEIKNAEFFVGEVENVLPTLFEQDIKADVIFVDPPRKGLDNKTIETITNLKPKKMIYISCNPATLARDLKLLTEDCFEIEKVKLIDMFPQTKHCESICILERR